MGMKEEWELIKEKAGSALVCYVWERDGVEFAICDPRWTDPNVTDAYCKRRTPLLRFYYAQLCELWAKYGPANFEGSLIDFALHHKDYVIWYNGERL